MQEQKNKRLFFLLLSLIALTVLAFWFTNQGSTIEVDKYIFRTGYEDVDRVELESSSGKVTLSFNGSQWKVNDVFPADRNLVNVLFATLKQAEPKRPVTNKLRDSLASALANNGVKVSLFSQQALKQSFYAGGNATKTQAFFKQANSNESYVMTIPGYRVYVSGIFELDESGWRDKYVFNFNWRNFEGLTVEYPEKTQEGFKVALQKDHFGIEGLTKVDTAKLNTFLDKISLLTVEQYSNNRALLDSLQKAKPVMVITVGDVGAHKYQLNIFMPQAGTVPVLIGEDQAALMNPNRIRELLKPKSFFISR